MQGGIFISYRRADTEPVAHRIYGSLADAFGADHVFIDADKLPFTDFRAHIVAEVKKSRVVLVLIGPRWLELIRAKARDPQDWVRVEIETALSEGVPLAPVLVGGAAMPRAEELPASIAQLAYINAMPVSPAADYAHHMRRLTQRLAAEFGFEMRSEAGNGGAVLRRNSEFHRRLLDIPPFRRKHVPPPTANDRWIPEVTFKSREGDRGFQFFSIYSYLAFEDPEPEAVVFGHAFARGEYGPNPEVFSFLELIRADGRTGRSHNMPFVKDGMLLGLTGTDALLVLPDSVKLTAIHPENTLDIILRNAKIRKHEMRVVVQERGQRILGGGDWDAPLIVLPHISPGSVKILGEWASGDLRATWCGGQAYGDRAIWSADLAICLIKSNYITEKYNKQSEVFLLRYEADRYGLRAINVDEQSDFVLHPSGLLVKSTSQKLGLQMQFIDSCTLETIHTIHINGLSDGKQIRFDGTGRFAVFYSWRAKKVSLIDLVEEVVIDEFFDTMNPTFSPDGMRLAGYKSGKHGVILPFNEASEILIGPAEDNFFRNDILHEAIRWCPSARRIYLFSNTDRTPTVTSYVLEQA